MFDFSGEFGAGFSDHPIANRIRNLIDSSVETSGGQLNLSKAVALIDEVPQHGKFAIQVILSRLYERLYRRSGLYLSLELLDFCVRNCGLDFAKYIKKEFLHAMTRLLKLTSINEQTLVGAVNSTMKIISKSIHRYPPELSKDVMLLVSLPRVEITALIRILTPSEVPKEAHIANLGKKESPAFEPGNVPSASSSSSASSSAPKVITEVSTSTPTTAVASHATLSSTVFTDHQMHQLTRSLMILQSNDVSLAHKIRCADICRFFSKKLVATTHHAMCSGVEMARISELLDLQSELEAAISSVNALNTEVTDGNSDGSQHFLTSELVLKSSPTSEIVSKGNASLLKARPRSLEINQKGKSGNKTKLTDTKFRNGDGSNVLIPLLPPPPPKSSLRPVISSVSTNMLDLDLDNDIISSSQSVFPPPSNSTAISPNDQPDQNRIATTHTSRYLSFLPEDESMLVSEAPLRSESPRTCTVIGSPFSDHLNIL